MTLDVLILIHSYCLLSESNNQFHYTPIHVLLIQWFLNYMMVLFESAIHVDVMAQFIVTCMFLFVFRNNNEQLWYNVRRRDGRLLRSRSNQVPIWRLAEPAFGVVQRGLHRTVSSETVYTLCETRSYNVEFITGETNYKNGFAMNLSGCYVAFARRVLKAKINLSLIFDLSLV